MVVALGGTASALSGGLGEASLSALSKVVQVLPNRLRRRAEALRAATVDAPFSQAPEVDAGVLAVVAQAIRDHERLRYAYTARGGRAPGEQVRRHVEPHQLVTVGRRWYLLGYDLDRQDWRSFRLDRLRDPEGTRAALPAARHPGRRRRGVRPARARRRRRDAPPDGAGRRTAAARRAPDRPLGADRRRRRDRRHPLGPARDRGQRPPLGRLRPRPPRRPGHPRSRPPGAWSTPSTSGPPGWRTRRAAQLAVALRQLAFFLAAFFAVFLAGFFFASRTRPRTRRGRSWRPPPTSAARPAGRRPRRRTWSRSASS